MSTHSAQILFLCTANVCRSPLGELLLRTTLGPLTGIEIISAGTHASEGDRICSLVVSHLEDDEWRAMADAHRSRRATADMLEQSTLILAAARDVRADAVQSNPSIRDRIFTISEVAYLGTDFRAEDGSTQPGLLDSYAEHLNRSRSRLGAAPQQHRQRWRRGRVDTFSVVDGHVRGVATHHRAIHDVVVAVGAIASQLDPATSLVTDDRQQLRGRARRL